MTGQYLLVASGSNSDVSSLNRDIPLNPGQSFKFYPSHHDELGHFAGHGHCTSNVTAASDHKRCHGVTATVPVTVIIVVYRSCYDRIGDSDSDHDRDRVVTLGQLVQGRQ